MAERWEYLIVPLGPVSFGAGMKALDLLGGDGWELVSVTQWERTTVAYLKRRVSPAGGR